MGFLQSNQQDDILLLLLLLLGTMAIRRILTWLIGGPQ